MNQGQEKFYHFIMERVAPQNEASAKALLNESFSLQDTGRFTPDYLMGFIPKMLDLLKPEYVEEVKTIMMNFKG